MQADVCLLGRHDERDARGRRHLSDVAGRHEASGLTIDAKGHHRPSVLVRAEQETARRIERNGARGGVLRRDAVDRVQLPGTGLDREDRDALVAAVSTNAGSFARKVPAEASKR